MKVKMMKTTVAYQGVPGAYSHLASEEIFPLSTLVASSSFYESMEQVEKEEVQYAVIPIENSSAGRVEEIYRLIPKMQLNIIAEHFYTIQHALMGLKNTKTQALKTVSSHPQALAQCANNIKQCNLEAISMFDTAGAAAQLKQTQNKEHGVIASSFAAKLYDLEILDDNFADYEGNVTRFIVLSKESNIPQYDKDKLYITSLIYSVKNIPAALYKSLGGFATNGIDLIKIESYSNIGSVYSTQFHVDLYGHIEQTSLQLALDELRYFCQDLKIIGVYERNEHRNIMY